MRETFPLLPHLDSTIWKFVKQTYVFLTTNLKSFYSLPNKRKTQFQINNIPRVIQNFSHSHTEANVEIIYSLSRKTRWKVFPFASTNLVRLLLAQRKLLLHVRSLVFRSSLFTSALCFFHAIKVEFICCHEKTISGKIEDERFDLFLLDDDVF